MSRAKRNSTVLTNARQRLAGIKSIEPAPDFGPGLTIAEYEAEINSLSSRVDSYHQDLSALDDKRNALNAAEATMHERNRRMLAAVQAKYGPDSSEFGQAGGKRVSDRKRPTRKTGGPVSPTT